MKINSEYLEIKSYLMQLATMLNMLIPKKVSVSYLSEITGKSRQSIHQYLHNNFEYEKDFWKEGGKSFVTKEVAISILQRDTNHKMLQAA